MHERKIKGKIKNRLRKPSARANKRNAAQRREQIQKNWDILRPGSSGSANPEGWHSIDKPRHELPRKVRVKAFISTDFEGHYYDDGQVGFFLDSERVNDVVLNRAVPCRIEVSLPRGAIPKISDSQFYVWWTFFDSNAWLGNVPLQSTLFRARRNWMIKAIFFMAIGAGAMAFYVYLNPGQLISVIDQVKDLIN